MTNIFKGIYDIIFYWKIYVYCKNSHEEILRILGSIPPKKWNRCRWKKAVILWCPVFGASKIFRKKRRPLRHFQISVNDREKIFKDLAGGKKGWDENDQWEEVWYTCGGGKRRGVEREEESLNEKRGWRLGRLTRRLVDVPEGTQIVIIFLWTLFLNLSGHLETLKFCYLLF